MPPLGGYRRPLFFFSFFGKAVAGRVLGGFSAGSRRVLGEFLANFGRNLGFGPPNLDQKASKKAPDDAKSHLKSIKNHSIFWNWFRKPPKGANPRVFSFILVHFGSILGAKIVDFSCYFLAWFFDGFLEASGCILGAIFGGLFGYFSRLCGKSRTPRVYCK